MEIICLFICASGLCWEKYLFEGPIIVKWPLCVFPPATSSPEEAGQPICVSPNCVLPLPALYCCIFSIIDPIWQSLSIILPHLTTILLVYVFSTLLNKQAKLSYCWSVPAFYVFNLHNCTFKQIKREQKKVQSHSNKVIDQFNSEMIRKPIKKEPILLGCKKNLFWQFSVSAGVVRII